MIRRLRVRFPSGTQKVFLREQFESVHIKNIIKIVFVDLHLTILSRALTFILRLNMTWIELSGKKTSSR